MQVRRSEGIGSIYFTMFSWPEIRSVAMGSRSWRSPHTTKKNLTPTPPMQPYLHSLTYILEPCCCTSSKAPSPTISNMGNPSLDILRQSLPEAVAISFEIMQLETSGHKLPASRVVVHPCPSEGAGLEQQEKV